MVSQQSVTDAANSDFWNELCRSRTAKVLGINDFSPESLKKFDEWYMDFYPYLYNHINFSCLAGKNILEIGLGYGTISQKIVESSAIYQGLDIAQGPVDLVNNRISLCNGIGRAIQGSILSPPFEPASFDMIISIGCLHHTGNLQEAINQCYTLLKPGGQFVFMVYYSYSYRRFIRNFLVTSKYLMKELFGFRNAVPASSSVDRGRYDVSTSGDAAPHTDWISAKSLQYFCSKFSSFWTRRENIDHTDIPFYFLGIGRHALINSPMRWFGLDIYAHAIK